ncbi:MAG: CYTH domain-containing protein [Phycisphaerales bacterium]
MTPGTGCSNEERRGVYHEIERKFLVRSSEWKKLGRAVPYRQGYLSVERGRTVRVRIAGNRAFLTIKSPAIDLVRHEFEYPIPLAHARFLLSNLCRKPIIEKTRTRVNFRGHVWEVDSFKGQNKGLVVAEIELVSADAEFPLPPWIGPEVTGQRKYNNSSLVKKPFSRW